MTTKDLWKALGLAFELWLFYVISTSIFGLHLDYGNPLQRIGAWIIFGVCLYIFVSTEYKRLYRPKTPQPKIYTEKPFKTVTDARKAVDRTVPKAFKKEMRELDTQVNRMNQKKKALNDALKSYFGDSKITYEKFARTVDGVEEVFLENTQRIVARVNIFDEEGYEDIFRKHLEYTSAIAPYNEHFKYVRNRLNENEEILSRMDKLLLEVTSLSDTSQDVDDLPAVQELSELIDQTKLYKQQH